MIKRGEIYFVKRRNELSFGTETAKSRPGIIVSNNILNATSEVVEVVYLTTQPKRNLPTHVNIEATGTSSVALCEQIDHVSVHLLERLVGICDDDEMAAVDRALLCSLGIEIDEGELVEDEDGDVEIEKPTNVIDDAVELFTECIKARAERDAYKQMLDRFFDEMKTATS